MGKKLLELESGKDHLRIPSEEIERVYFSYNFEDNKLEIKPKGKPDEVVPMYLISKELVTAINAAIVTGKPLLLKGDPGCGKTKLAKAVAIYLYGKHANKYYFEWFIKSSSSAQEGAYRFDQVRRFKDASFFSSNRKKESDNLYEYVDLDPSQYITLGPLGKAFMVECGEEEFPILLIDEIDKGNIDFPNDLLLELDEMRFSIPELNQSKKYKNRINFESKLRHL